VPFVHNDTLPFKAGLLDSAFFMSSHTKFAKIFEKEYFFANLVLPVCLYNGTGFRSICWAIVQTKIYSLAALQETGVLMSSLSESITSEFF
jgi:hypothetical protein